MLLLCSALKAHLERTVEDIFLKDREESLEHPKVIVGWLVPKNASNTEDDHVPCIQVVPLSGEDYDLPHQGGLCSVLLQIQTWARDYQGWKDCINIIQALRLSLLSLPARTLDNKYRLVENEKKFLSWRLFEDPPAPYYVAEMTVHFEIPAPVPVHPWEK